jgi:hypothetical protein
MDYKAKLDILRNELECSIKFFQRKHRMTKHRANIIKAISVCFSAMITVILGLSSGRQNQDLLMDIALFMGSVVTIINAADAFYGYGALWIKNSVTLAKLRELRRKVEFYGAGREISDISEVELSKYLDELQQILKDDINQWLRIREKVNSIDQNKDNDSLIDMSMKLRGIKGKINNEDL